MSVERELGELKEQGKWVAKEMYSLSQHVKRIESKVDSVIRFKWQIIGGASVCSFLAALVVEFLVKKGP